MSCPDIQYLELFLNNQLSEDEKSQVEKHLKSCEHCNQEFEEVRENQVFLQDNKILLNSLGNIQANDFSQEDARLLLPKNFNLLKRIRHGNYSCVFKARELDTDRLVAIKFLFKGAVDFDDWSSEARTTANFKHPNIVSVYETKKKDETVYTVMEWVEGGSIVDVCLKLPIDQRIKVFHKALEAFSCVHDKNIVHRDIKPSNILVNSKQEPKILDFGISVEYHLLDSSGSNVFRGSPQNSSPEQIPPLGKITPSTDVFSLGILLYQLMTGKLPFSQKTTMKLFNAIKHEQPRLPTLINPSIPKKIERVCLKALNKSPDQRYADAGAMAQDIQGYLNQSLKKRHNDKSLSSKNRFYLSELDTASFELPLSEGDLIGSYRIISKLGHGVTDTYIVLNVATNHERVIKVIISNNPESESNLNQFISEVGMHDKISDFAHIIKSLEPQLVSLDGLTLIIFPMECADAGNLEDWLKNSIEQDERLSAGVDLFLQACRGIAAAHTKNVTHLNIKSQNILLCSNDGDITAKVADFGVLQNLNKYSFDVGDLNKNTLAHLSPELIDPALITRVGFASDIYSLGIVLYEILVGKMPFQGSSESVKQQHLEAKIPNLKGELKRWMPIVSRCLAKDIDKRYLNVELLIRDIENLRKDYSLSVDIACHNCGHINNAPKLLDCQECSTTLPENFFRPCQACKRPVRLDQKDCPWCLNSGVAAYYLFEHRKKQVELLKDVDPVKAMDLLDLILKEGAPDYAKEAQELVSGLYQKQKSIDAFAKEAKKFVESGEIEKAVSTWRKVLKIIPRHRTAVERIGNLETLLEDVDGKIKQAVICMEQGKLKTAEELLRYCLEHAPNRPNLRTLTDSCYEKTIKYNEAFDNAQRFIEQKDPGRAKTCIDWALRQCPKSSEANELSDSISAKIKQVEEFVIQAEKALLQADFKKVEQRIRGIEEIDLKNNQLKILQKKLISTRDIYSQLLNDSHAALISRDFVRVVEILDKALDHCPDSFEADSLLEQTKCIQEEACRLIQVADKQIEAAKFIQARSSLTETESLWPKVEGLQDKRQQLSVTENKYREHFNLAVQAKTNKNTPKAIEELQTAIKLCHQSSEARKLLESLEESMKQFEALIDLSSDSVKRANFSGAYKRLKEAEEIWPDSELLVKTYDDLSDKEITYKYRFERAQTLFSERNYKMALFLCKESLEISPKSKKAINLEGTIHKRINEIKQRKRQRREAIRKFFNGVKYLLTFSFLRSKNKTSSSEVSSKYKYQSSKASKGYSPQSSKEKVSSFNLRPRNSKTFEKGSGIGSFLLTGVGGLIGRILGLIGWVIGAAVTLLFCTIVGLINCFITAVISNFTDD